MSGRPVNVRRGKADLRAQVFHLSVHAADLLKRTHETPLGSGEPELSAPPACWKAAAMPGWAVSGTSTAHAVIRPYCAANPGADLSWYAGLHFLRILSELAIWRREHDPRAAPTRGLSSLLPRPPCSPAPPPLPCQADRAVAAPEVVEGLVSTRAVDDSTVR